MFVSRFNFFYSYFVYLHFFSIFMHIFISLVFILFFKKMLCVLCLHYHCCCHKNKPTQKNTTAAIKQTHPKKNGPVGRRDELRVAVNRRMTGWMKCPFGWMDRGTTLGEASFNIPSTEIVRSTEASFHPLSGFRGSFIRPASGANGIQGKPTKRTDLREASFGRLHSCFTICNFPILP